MKFNQMIDAPYSAFNGKNYSDTISLSDSVIKKAQSDGRLAQTTKDEILVAMYTLKGFALLGLNDLDSAKTAYNQALEINSVSSQAIAGLAEILYMEYKTEHAKSMFELALQANPMNLFARGGIMRCNEALEKGL